MLVLIVCFQSCSFFFCLMSSSFDMLCFVPFIGLFLFVFVRPLLEMESSSNNLAGRITACDHLESFSVISEEELR